jgi:hypothetical protein
MSVTTLNMYEHSDSEFDAEMIIGDTVDELIDGLVDPLSAAQTVDRTIVAQCQDSSDDIISGERLRAITPEGWLGFLWNVIGSLATGTSSDLPGQDRLVSMLQDLQRMPRHTVPYNLNGQHVETELYILNHAIGYEDLKVVQWMIDLGPGG